MTIQHGVCTECGSTEIYTRKGWFHNVVVAFMPPRTHIYVCGTCGYLAEFVDEGRSLEHIRASWERLEPSEKRKNDAIIDEDLQPKDES